MKKPLQEKKLPKVIDTWSFTVQRDVFRAGTSSAKGLR